MKEGKGGRIIDNLQADTYKLITFRQAGAVAVVNLLYSINTLCRPDLTTTEQPADSTFFLYRPEYKFSILHWDA